MKRDALQIIRKSIQAVDPYEAVKSHLKMMDDSKLHVGSTTTTTFAATAAAGAATADEDEDEEEESSYSKAAGTNTSSQYYDDDGRGYYPLADYNKIVLIAFGKASSAMATAVVQQLYLNDLTTVSPATMGVCICKDDHATKQEIKTLEAFGCSVLEASHPVPDERSSKAAQQALELVQRHASPTTLVICCISGGGSALFCQPHSRLTLEDLQETNQALLASGMSIQDCNVIRKRLEQGKGGRLAQACHPSQLITLVLSDVLGDPLDLIASGPTVPDTSTPKDAMEIVKRYQLQDKLPNQVMTLLEELVNTKDENNDPATLSSDHPVFAQAQTVLVGNNALAVQAAADEAKELGYHPVVLGTQIEGEAKEMAIMYTRMALHLQQQEQQQQEDSSSPMSSYSMAPSLPVALIAGGETTVSLGTSDTIGKGGRNQELALSAALELQSLGLNNVVLASVGTDGTDGPTDAAGAMVDARTIPPNEASLEEARNALANHDAYPFLDALGNGNGNDHHDDHHDDHHNDDDDDDDDESAVEDRPLIKTGPTGTNVADVCVTLIR
ncbi:MAG: hypothetical protein SGBAC_009708 [Bacillariaceae sp.]